MRMYADKIVCISYTSPCEDTLSNQFSYFILFYLLLIWFTGLNNYFPVLQYTKQYSLRHVWSFDDILTIPAHRST